MNYKITLFFALILAFFIETNAQTIQQFKAKEGLTFANTESKKSSTNPKLRSIASLAGNYGGLDLTFDINKGVSSIWVYVYQDDTNKDSIIVVPVLKVPLFSYVNAKTLISNLPITDFLKFLPSSLLATTNWIDSDQLGLDILANGDYKTYMSKNPTEKPSLLGMGNNELNPLLKKGEAYWTITIGTAGPKALNCSVHALTRETSCLSLTSVEEDFLNNNPTFPNPASNYVYITVPNNFINEDSMLELYKNDGTKILENKIYKVDGNKFHLPTDFLVNGNYFVKVGNSKLNFVQSFIVKK